MGLRLPVMPPMPPMSFDGIHRLHPDAMTRTHIAPPPMREVKRRVPLSVASDATFEAWLREDTGRTLEEFAQYEWTNRPLGPPPPPPSRPPGALGLVINRAIADEDLPLPKGGTAEVRAHGR